MTDKKNIMKNETKTLTKNSSLQNSSNWMFFAGVTLSCIGEAILLSYLVFLFGEIKITDFAMAFAALVTGNLLMLRENKTQART